MKNIIAGLLAVFFLYSCRSTLNLKKDIYYIPSDNSNVSIGFKFNNDNSYLIDVYGTGFGYFQNTGTWRSHRSKIYLHPNVPTLIDSIFHCYDSSFNDDKVHLKFFSKTTFPPLGDYDFYLINAGDTIAFHPQTNYEINRNTDSITIFINRDLSETQVLDKKSNLYNFYINIFYFNYLTTPTKFRMKNGSLIPICKDRHLKNAYILIESKKGKRQLNK